MFALGKTGPVTFVLGLAFLAGSSYAAVITNITLVDNLVNGNASFAYNFQGTGAHSTGGCPNNPPASCTLSFTGTSDLTGNATSSFENATMNGFTPASTNPDISAYSASAAAFAAANMGAASVGVGDSGDYLDYRFPESGQGGGSATSFAQANDTLHFLIEGAQSNTVTDITVSFVVHGGMTAPTPAGDSNGSLQSILQFGTAHEETDVNLGVNTQYSPVLQPLLQAGGWVSQSLVGTPGLFTFTGVYALTGSEDDLGIAETLSEGCGLGTNCDYSNTGIVSFSLPGNVSFTSDSGIFLTETGAVPEPSTGLLFGTVAAGLILIQKRYRKAR